MFLFKRLLILALAAPLLASCGLFVSKQSVAMRKTPDYHAGYQDGCDSAEGPDANKRADGQVRDEELFKTSQAYRVGWNAGFSGCRTYVPQGASNPNSGPIPDKMPGSGIPQ